MTFDLEKEQSRALPCSQYRDPAEVIEIKQLTELGCRACGKHLMFNGRVACTEPRKTHQKDVPKIGRKCKYFELKG